MAKIKNRQHLMLTKCRKVGSLTHCWWEWEIVQPLWQTVCQFLIKLNIPLLCNPAIALLGVHHTQKLCWHKSCYTNVHNSSLSKSLKLETTFVFFSEWMGEPPMVHPTMGYNLSIERNELLTHTTIWISLQGTEMSRKSQLHTLWFHLYNIL